MPIEIITIPLTLNIHGFSGIAINKDYPGTAFKLMDKMWQVVKSKKLSNKGKNIWVYGPGDMVFAGVELTNAAADTGLEQKNITHTQYAYHKHVGPYHLIKQAGINMTTELKRQGIDNIAPYIEIYGHWTNDESKLETELLMGIQ